ncbi:MAG: peroxidase family protein [Pseudomonadota bacterium]
MAAQPCLTRVFAASLILSVSLTQAQPPRDSDAEPRPDRPDQNRADLRGPDQPREERIDEISPVRRIEREARREDDNRPPGQALQFRSIDGADNNLSYPSTNTTGEELRRLMDADYGDGLAAPAGEGRPSARLISNQVAAQEDSMPNARGATDFLWQWGQFLDHDIDLTDGVEPAEPLDIPIPAGDPWFDPTGSGTQVMSFNRSIYAHDSDISAGVERQQLNEITGWIDASNVYGSTAERAAALRTRDGTGRLRTSAGNLLPFNVTGLPNAGGTSDTLFLAGDVRANEQVGLAAMHTLFVREHNRQVRELSEANPRWRGERLYREARERVAALMQIITYEEFLPVLLGANNLPPYAGYDPERDARISNSFSTAAYRMGHSLLSPEILRLDENLDTIAAGNLPLRAAFFAPDELVNEGIESVLRGLAMQACQDLDSFVVDDIRNFLFGPPGSGGFDLASLNIQRGRDHGLPSYNNARFYLGLTPAEDFADVSSDPAIQARLAAAYDHVDDIDLWVGGLAEDDWRGSMLGELFTTLLVEQFTALREGDRFWYEVRFDSDTLSELSATRLSDIVRRNTDIGDELPDNVFLVERTGRGRR